MIIRIHGWHHTKSYDALNNSFVHDLSIYVHHKSIAGIPEIHGIELEIWELILREGRMHHKLAGQIEPAKMQDTTWWWFDMMQNLYEKTYLKHRSFPIIGLRKQVLEAFFPRKNAIKHVMDWVCKLAEKVERWKCATACFVTLWQCRKEGKERQGVVSDWSGFSVERGSVQAFPPPQSPHHPMVHPTTHQILSAQNNPAFSRPASIKSTLPP